MQTSNDFDTAQNRDADPHGGAANRGSEDSAFNKRVMDDDDWLQIANQNKSVSDSYTGPLKTSWADCYNAYRNQHSSKSMYNRERWRGRSKLHRPKTRSAVHKADAAFAQSLFATSEVVSIEAQNPLDPAEVASAEVNKALLNHRLDRKSGKNGIPWFQIAVGAHNDARITGIVISKQFWEYRTADSGEVDQIPAVGPKGLPVFDKRMKPVMTTKKRIRVVRDRPMVHLFPAELVLRDPGANWVDQAQESSFIGLMYPMTVGDIEAMIDDDQAKTVSYRWRKVTRSQLMTARLPTDSASVRNAREGQTADRIEQSDQAAQEFHRCWVIEWFVRFQGREWHYWTAGTTAMLSTPTPTGKVYPEYDGERPIVIGVAAIEPHKIDPISPVAAALPLQDEINSLVNLRIDGVKESIRPLTIIKKGSMTDVAAIQNRSGDSAVYANDPQNDIKFDRPGNIGQESYLEMAHLNADYDDLAGQFNTGSVQTNRQLNETVGGMKLLNNNANVVGDFDTRVLIETWVEPVLRQLVRLEQYYEDDQTILKLAGKKAQLYQKYGVSEVTNELLNRELSISVSAGIGTADPTVKLSKFQAALTVAVGALGPELALRAKQDAVIDEVFGSAGFKDASQRFFYQGDQTDPRIKKATEAVQMLKAELESKEAEYANERELKRMDVAGEIVNEIIKNEMDQQNAAIEFERTMQTTQQQQTHETETTQQQQAHEAEMGAAEGDRAMEAAAMKPAPGSSKGNSKGNGKMPINDPMQARFANSVMSNLMPPGPPPPPDPMPAIMGMMQQMQQQQQQSNAMMLQMMAQISQGLSRLGQGLEALGMASTAPKRLIRDDSGSPIGVVTVAPDDLMEDEPPMGPPMGPPPGGPMGPPPSMGNGGFPPGGLQ